MLSVRGIYQKGEIKLKEQVPGDREIPVIVTFLEDIENIEDTQKTTKKYRFSDLAGKLTWSGNAVAQQRTLRDEW
jgi:hypothetical protein